ncbi:hypothetical protein HAHE_19800 [Haloferula helveola]|uniref:Thioredoxin domain-containing protein n=2 Tax=Haloferula helveola TaxID=490095 RepID=A0ABM7RCA0_9BACT|nr:hypothetical protein HAHE_19800 [Haloferula helveola]
MAAWARSANPEEPRSVQEAFLGAPSLLPREIEGLEPLTFPVDSASDEARRWFGQGLACLHLLWNEEAERAFRAVVAADPDCAMGYWGLAMVNVDRPGRGAYFARMAAGKLRPQSSATVRTWVEAVQRYYADPAADPVPRHQRFASDLEDLAIAEPNNVEAKAIFLRQLVLNAYRGGLELRSPWAADRLAAEITAAVPGHPARSHRLLLWMNSKPNYLADQGLLDPGRLPPEAVVSQWRFLAEAQGAAGRWEASAESMVRSVDAGIRHRKGWFDQPLLVPGFDENVEVLAGTLSLLGRVEEALSLARAMVAQPLPSTVVGTVDTDPFNSSAYARGLRSYARICIEHGLQERLSRYATDLPVQQVPGDSETVLRGEIEALAAGKPAGDIAWLSPEARLAGMVAAGESAAAELLASLPDERCRAFLPRALKILHHVEAGRTKEAMQAFDNSFRAAAGAADSPWLRSDGFVKLAQLRRVTGDWPLAPTPAANRLAKSVEGVRKDYLSGFPGAPGFVLPDGTGSETSLAAFRGRPVLVIFFLGAGCLQCVEQLHAFLPLGPRFEEAGIPIVAISSDPVEVLEFTIREERRGQKPIPFTILSDSELEVFRDYLVYNEFEKRPVHGTFLLDAEGHVRWWTTDNQPFMDPLWLLRESSRILD